MKKEYIGESGYILFALTAIVDLLKTANDWDSISNTIFEALYVIALVLVAFDIYLGWKKKKNVIDRIILLIVFIALFIFF
tara:strand:- start:73 stop:312 length:240 start_codon:yes stop_codon:yes gene_type:complete